MKTKTLKSPYHHMIRALLIFFIIFFSLSITPIKSASFESIQTSVDQYFAPTYSQFNLVYHSNGSIYQPFVCLSSVSSNQFNVRTILFKLDENTLSFKSKEYDNTITLSGTSSPNTRMSAIAVSGYNDKMIILLSNFFSISTTKGKIFLGTIVLDLSTLSHTTGYIEYDVYTFNAAITVNFDDYVGVVSYSTNNLFSFIFTVKTYDSMNGYRYGFVPIVAQVNPTTAQISYWAEYRTRNSNEVIRASFFMLDGSLVYLYGIGRPNYMALWKVDVGTWSLNSFTYTSNKKVPLFVHQVFYTSSWKIFPVHITPVSKNVGQNDAYYRVFDRVYVGLDSDSNKVFYSRYLTLYIAVGSDTIVNDEYYVLDPTVNYVPCGEWKGYMLKYHGWRDLYGQLQPFVIGYNTMSRTYQVVSYTPLFSKEDRYYMTNAYEFKYLTESSLELRYQVAERPTYTISLPSSTTTTLTYTYYQSPTPLTEETGANFLINVIIPFSIILIPVSIFYYLMGLLGALIGLGIGVGLLQLSGFAPFSLIVIVVLISAVALWRGINTRKDNEA